LKTALLEDEDAVLNEASALQTKEVVLCSEVPDSLKELLTTRLSVVFSKQEAYEENAEFRFLTSDLPEAKKKLSRETVKLS
jgi:DNA mismatch repair protein MutS